jgi:translation initiation factor IF-2
VFKVGKTQAAGCYVLSGGMARNAEVRVLRGEQRLFDGRLQGLRRFKDEVREVQAGYECGISLEGFAEFQEGDIIEAYTRERIS